MLLAVAVALAAGLGAVARVALAGAVQARTGGRLPYGTLLVNTSGSLLLGLVLGLAVSAGLPDAVALVLGSGFAGGYTTLSTYAWETVQLGRDERGLAVAYALGSVALGLLAAAAGLGLARLAA